MSRVYTSINSLILTVQEELSITRLWMDCKKGRWIVKSKYVDDTEGHRQNSQRQEKGT